MNQDSWIAWQLPRYFKAVPIMWGPGVAALVALYLFRRTHPRTITLGGRSARESAAFFLVPVAALAAAYAPVVGVRGLALLAGIAALGFFNILGEELGWRGFLQDALRPLGKVPRYMLIGGLWEFWHFTNRVAHAPFPAVALRLAIMYPATMLISALIGEAVDRKRALVVGVTLHFWLNAVWEIPALLEASPTPTYLVLAGSVVFWAVMLARGSDRWRTAAPASAATAV
jgi:hypothetical protein